jgi:hypothetical protein
MFSRSGCRGLDLAHVVGACTVDRDASQLHGLGDFALKVDDEEAVLEARSLDLNVIGERELALEGAGRDAVMEEGLFFLIALPASEFWSRLTLVPVLIGWKLACPCLSELSRAGRRTAPPLISGFSLRQQVRARRLFSILPAGQRLIAAASLKLPGTPC